jgi:protein-L-isoaspartate(D-aspartate) O-methyltransferase
MIRSALPAVAFMAMTCTPDMPSQSADERRRHAMVEDQIRARGVRDAGVLAAMREVPRDRFVPDSMAASAYDDRALAIGHGQTISQPYVVALMTAALGVLPHHRVLEIGTGSGYQAAVLGRLAREVYTIEIVPELAGTAATTLKELGYSNIQVRTGDGFAGWPAAAPFDRIMVTAAPEEIPPPLIDQLAEGGRLVVPVGRQGEAQWITVVEKVGGTITQRRTESVYFVPFTRSK